MWEIAANGSSDPGEASVAISMWCLAHGCWRQVETECGDIRVASSYCDQAKFCTNRGNMHLRNVHNESYIAIYELGDLKIHGIDGSTNIFVKQGDVDAQVSKVYIGLVFLPQVWR